MPVPLAKLDFTAAEMVREHLDAETVERYREAIRDGDELPALVAFFDGETLYCPDGRHRAAAYAAEGRDLVPCEVRPGSQDDAFLNALQSNVTHGLRRSREDTRLAIRAALEHPAIGLRSSREIGLLCRCDHKTVESVRGEVGNSPVDPKQDPPPPAAPERRIGRDGKSRRMPAARSVTAHQRRPGSEAEAGRADPIGEPAKGPVAAFFDGKSSKPSTAAHKTDFDDSQHEKLIGPLIRFYQARAEYMGCAGCKEHRRLGALMDEVIAEFRGWQRRVAA